jgi:nucleotide-binding universal stress UspA family protein
MTDRFAPELRHRPRVLAGSSLGPESDDVVRAALAFARSGHGRLHVVHALEPPPLPAGSIGFGLAVPHLAERARLRILEQLERAGARALEVAGVEVECGSAGAVLRAAAERSRADLIVVAPAAAAPLPLQRAGTTARSLLRDGGRSVLVVRGETRLPPRRVLAPIDLSPSAGDSLRCGLALLAGPDDDSLPDVTALRVVEDERPGAAEAKTGRLAPFLDANLADYPGPLRPEVRQGDAVTEIVAEIERTGPDLVLLGTHGRTGWRRWRLGSVAETVIDRSPVSVLVVPPRAAFGSALAEAVAADLHSSS